MYNNNSNSEFRSMKRAHSPDTFDTGHNNNFRGGQHHFRGGHHQNYHNQYNKRHRGNYHGGYDQPPQTTEEMISRLGDTGQKTQDIGMTVKQIDIDLSNKANEEEKIKNITAQICKSIVSFPTRTATYSTLIGLISVKHYNVSCQILNSLQASYPMYLEAQKWKEALTIMHLLASLVNCRVIHPASLIAQFEVLLQVIDEQNIPQTRSDYYVYTVMSSLPYVAQELANPTDGPNNFTQILTKIENYLNARTKDHLSSIRIWLSNDETVQMDYLDSLWVQMKNFRANNWTETFLPRPYYDKEYKDIMVSSLIPQSSPTILIPEHSSEYIYPNPRIVLRIFDDDVTEGRNSIPGSDKIERFCIENHIRNIINEISTDAKNCARHLYRMHRSENLPIKHLLIETILGEIFALPKTTYDQIYYHIVLCELNKNIPISKDDIKNNFDYLVTEAVKVLYNNLETMNVTCYSRFIEWFSFHLNNTEFIFPFGTWADASMDKEKTSAKALFVQDIIERCVRLSFQEKVQTIVIISLPDFVPKKPIIKYQPVFASNPNSEQLAATIRKLIVEKANGAQICETLNIIIDGVELPETFVPFEEKLADKLLKIDIFTSVILHLAQKSLTHLSSAIGKYKNVFKALVSAEGGQVQLLQTMQSCLEEHTHLQIILVDKLLRAELIDARAVCCWLFSDSMKPLFLKSYPWEILTNATNRLNQLIRKLKKEIDNPIVVETPVKNQDAPDRPTTPVHKDDDGDNVDTKPDIDIKQESTMTQSNVDNNKDVEMEQSQKSTDGIEAKKAELQARLDVAKLNLNKLLMQVFNMFGESITDHMRQCETNGLDHKDKWYKWITGRMQQLYYNHYDTIQRQEDILKIITDYVNYK